MQRRRAIAAAFVNPQSDRSVRLFEKAYLIWNAEGVIEYFSPEPPPAANLVDCELEFYADQIVLPGFIDLHTHLPQYEFVAQGSATLLDWLNRYTYPQEARFGERVVAENLSKVFFSSCLAEGTTTVVAYLSPFREAAEIAFAEAERCGIRAYLGLALMDRDVPHRLATTLQDAEENMLSLIARFHKKSRCEFVVTPRFALSCSAELMALCGKTSREHDTFLQTHIAENSEEVDEVLRRFPAAASYAEVYDRSGCLHAKTLLGHGIHLRESERNLIRQKNSVIVHCPVSNNFLSSGIMPYAKYHDEGIRLGLGTDVAAGYSLSMLHEAKQMVEMAKLKSVESGAAARHVSTAHAIYQATLGNAAALGRENELGSFAVGKRADFVRVDDAKCSIERGGGDSPFSSLSDRLNRILYRPHSEMIRATYIDGEVVFAR